MLKKVVIGLLIAGLALCAFLFAGKLKLYAYITGEDPARFESAVQAIEARYGGDKPQGAAVFLGSSSIRFWSSLKTDMAPTPVLNHGFGGSKINDALYFMDRLVTDHDPRALILFSGTNDINGVAGNTKDSETVIVATLKFFSAVRAKHPEMPIIYIPITPTPSRWHVWNEAKAVNGKIKSYTETDSSLYYVDMTANFLKDGAPNPDLFIVDKLHMNDQGYAIWAREVKPVLIRALSER